MGWGALVAGMVLLADNPFTQIATTLVVFVFVSVMGYMARVEAKNRAMLEEMLDEAERERDQWRSSALHAVDAERAAEIARGR